jgi:hypothetical protein
MLNDQARKAVETCKTQGVSNATIRGIAVASKKRKTREVDDFIVADDDIESPVAKKMVSTYPIGDTYYQ